MKNNTVRGNSNSSSLMHVPKPLRTAWPWSVVPGRVPGVTECSQPGTATTLPGFRKHHSNKFLLVFRALVVAVTRLTEAQEVSAYFSSVFTNTASAGGREPCLQTYRGRAHALHQHISALISLGRHKALG